MLSLGLCAMLIISMLGLFTYLLNGATKTSDLGAGQIFAAQKLDGLIQTATYDQTAYTSGVGGAYVTDITSQTNFYYNVTTTSLSASSATANTTYTGGYYLTVQVWWNSDSPTQCRPGVGLQSTQASRFIYPRVLVP